ncbi:uncharacterized protein LOC125221083 [Salvia hispanica]|uniref:uncharacterized protein LOC125221083 n=1 Tax=Salvia hispanica TaxID=49212 RepID=UPI002009C13B|nr:uncharacterized protein LOC125221083 [Salvia hispanica]
METRDEYFQEWEDAAHIKGLSPMTKCTVALRQLAYGTTADMFDEYLHVEDTTSRECLGVLIVCTGSGRIVLQHGEANSPVGSNNDIIVLNSSSLFIEQCNGHGPVINFTANGRQHHIGYYLADGIYPR